MATIVTEPYNCTFVHIPKTGGNSITTWLKENFNASVTKRKQHATVNTILTGDHSLGPITEKELGWKFCVVRNPWDYIVSWYTFEIMLCNYYIEKCLTDPKWKHPTKDKYNIKLQQEKLARLEANGFENFVQQTTRLDQLHWAKDCDYIIKFEKMNDDFKEVQNRLNCYKPLPHLNKTSERKTGYRDYYTSQKIIDCVAKKYAQDIKSFNYDF
jgi:hypothetical protein